LDEQCTQILSNCHKALPPNGKVVIIEFAKPENPEPTIASQFVLLKDKLKLHKSAIQACNVEDEEERAKNRNCVNS